jgi:prepilin-type N-terminal cleavage/methylation domain-containing protein
MFKPESMVSKVPPRAKCFSMHGFSLVELLVVIAVIAVLAALLLPVLSSAKQNGQMASCLNNTRQLIIATHSYADSSGGWLPPNPDFKSLDDWVGVTMLLSGSTRNSSVA